jgi:hypothetical protein
VRVSDDGAFALTPGVGWAPHGNVTLNLDAVLLPGPEEREYRVAPVRGALWARLKVLLQEARAVPGPSGYFTSSSSRDGSAGKGACGSAWYQ